MKNWHDWLLPIENEFVFNKSNFLQQPNISRTIHPKFHGGQNLYDLLKATMSNLNIKESPIGNPYTNTNFNGYSLSTVQSMYYIHLMENLFKFDLKNLEEVCDIGGGYGNLCYTLRQYGYNGLHKILDFETLNNIQDYWLSNTLVTNYECTTMTDESLQPKSNNSLLVGTFSINEMGLPDRQKIEPYYSKHKYIFIAHKHNNSFGVDNKKYFDELKNKLKDTHSMQVYNCPLRKNDYYLIGERK